MISPNFFYFHSENEVNNFISEFFHEDEIIIHDTILMQIGELIKIRNPQKVISKDLLQKMVFEFLGETPIASYGVWVYYPWNKNLVHLLPENEFIEVRTNRNQYKITPFEQAELNKKIVGIIGLSVGQSIALTMAMERSFGELRIADFDTLDLSNLNRLRGSICQIGLPKTVICAREILELDPFLKITLFDEGIHEDNIDSFFLENGKIDLLIEECDGLDIKILARQKAKEYQIPVLMETSDRGLLDIERFDLEPERLILHGLVGKINIEKLKGLSQEDKIEYLLPMVGLNSLSERMKASMIEVQSSITSWPQLASAVTMGGGVAAEMARKILLNQSTVSGRFYVDLDELISEPKTDKNKFNEGDLLKCLSESEIKEIIDSTPLISNTTSIKQEDLIKIVQSAIMAPSGGNTQPWRIVFNKGNLILIHDIYYSQSFLDFAHLGTYFAFGSMIENIKIQSAILGYSLKYQVFPNSNDKRVVATCQFENNELKSDLELEDALFSRMTIRSIGEKQALPPLLKSKFEVISQNFKPAKITLIEDPQKMSDLADILSTAEMLLLLHPKGHFDIFNKELRFTEKEVLETRDGLDIATLNMNKAEILALKIASSRKAIEWVEKIGGGEAFKKNTKKAIAHSSALGIISMPFFSAESYLFAGEFSQRLWLTSTLNKISIQPVTQYSYLHARFLHGEGVGFDENYKNKFKELNSRFKLILPELSSREIVFIFRLATEKEQSIRSLRRNLESVFISINNDKN